MINTVIEIFTYAAYIGFIFALICSFLGLSLYVKNLYKIDKTVFYVTILLTIGMFAGIVSSL